jgi:hypothetical protein
VGVRNAILFALGLVFALVVFLLIWTTEADPRVIGLIVAAIIGSVGIYYVWLSSHPADVPSAMRTYPWARTPRGIANSGVLIIIAAIVIAVLGFVVRLPD